MSTLSDPRRLTLLRHAQASPAGGDVEDFERALDATGRHQASERGAAFAERCARHPVDHIVTSTAVRTVATAKAYAHALGFPLSRVRHDDRLYDADLVLMWSVIQRAPTAARHVLLVGHNPGISELAARLLTRSATPLAQGLSPCDSVTLVFDGPWMGLSDIGVTLDARLSGMTAGA